MPIKQISTGAIGSKSLRQRVKRSASVLMQELSILLADCSKNRCADAKIGLAASILMQTISTHP